MKSINFSDIDINSGFWKVKQDMVKNTTVYSVYDRFAETGRFDALKCDWVEGSSDAPHIFWDSDVAKWIEGTAYLLQKEDNPKLREIVENANDLIIKNTDENGYFNSHFLVTRKNERFTHRSDHELYCAGHLIEAAVAYYEATGEDRFLKAMCRFADYIKRVFKNEKSAAFATPGHPEPELALVRLYDATKEKRYLELAKYFIDIHGDNDNDIETHNGKFNEYYNQDEMPLKDRQTAEGHSVRAMYLMCGAIDVALRSDDEELKNACRRVFDNVIEKRMYITGGIGSSYKGEAFTTDYDLPPRTAYAETCAAISLAMFASRMQLLEVDSRYADTVERALYNGILSGVSMDGDKFFYENPLEIDLEFNNVHTSLLKDKDRYAITQRVKVFDCSCCPPNIVRFIPSVASMMYTYDSEALYVHQYIDSTAKTDNLTVTQKTNYPIDGTVNISCSTDKKFIALRIPSWCRNFKLNKTYTLKNGYAYVQADGEDVELEFDMSVNIMRANPEIHASAGKIAVTRGPVVYCIEEIDNGRNITDIRLDINSEFTLEASEFIIPNLKTKAYRRKPIKGLYVVADNDFEETELKLIPYNAFANRGESSMLVWINEK